MQAYHNGSLSALRQRAVYAVRFAVLGVTLIFLTSCSNTPADYVHRVEGTGEGSYTYEYVKTNALDQPADVPTDMELTASVDGLELYLDELSTRFAVRDQWGKLWYSSLSEEDIDADETAHGEYRRALSSLLTVRTCNTKGEMTKEYASSRHSVEDGTYTVHYMANEQGTQIGFRIDFEFSELSLTIPLIVGIRDGRLFANVPLEEMKVDDPETVVLEIGLLPHFGSASSGDTGYMLVPDGCGSIINMNNGKVASGGFETQIYGADDAFVKSRKTGNEEKALLPVFGMKNGNAAFLAVISSCDAYATVVAEVPGINTDRNYVFTRFRLKELDSFPLKDLGGKAQDHMVVDTNIRKLPPLETEYCFLSEENAGYVGMADEYATWLQDHKGLREQKKVNAFVLELYGAVRREKSVRGVPATVTEKLTTFQQADAMVEKLSEQGLPVPLVRYQYATNSCLKNRVSDQVDILAALGGKTEYDRFVSRVRDKGSNVYLGINTMTAKESLFGTGYVRNITNLKVYQYRYDPLTGYQDPSTKYCLYTPDTVFNRIKALLEDASKTETIQALELKSLACRVYSSFGNNYFSREDTKHYFEEALALASESNVSLLLDGGAYALPYASVVADVPVQSNHYYIEDYDVPFYQLAVSRFVSCVSQPINLTSNPQLQFLRCLQTGSVPQFTFVAGDPTVLQETELSELFAVDFEEWLPGMAQLVREWQAVQKATNNSPLISFRVLQDGLTETVYENGANILVNLKDTAIVYDDAEIPPSDFRIVL